MRERQLWFRILSLADTHDLYITLFFLCVLRVLCGELNFYFLTVTFHTIDDADDAGIDGDAFGAVG